ncbi:MAG: hypothetical protein GXO78_03490 [Calditrichaeota bacterium]|nr:hypothetical protein [Calditrichota bacterium]
MVPIKIQYLQAGVLSGDKQYLTQRKLPEIHQQVLENSIQQYLEGLQNKPVKAEGSEKALLKEKGEDQEKGRRGSRRGKETKKATPRSAEGHAIIEKDEEGHVKHLDVKI